MTHYGPEPLMAYFPAAHPKISLSWRMLTGAQSEALLQWHGGGAGVRSATCTPATRTSAASATAAAMGARSRLALDRGWCGPEPRWRARAAQRVYVGGLTLQ
jgi:hypothetical protein